MIAVCVDFGSPASWLAVGPMVICPSTLAPRSITMPSVRRSP